MVAQFDHRHEIFVKKYGKIQQILVFPKMISENMCISFVKQEYHIPGISKNSVNE